MISSQSISTDTSLVAATGSIVSYSLSSQLVGKSGITLDIVVTFGSTILTGDSVIFKFSSEFVRNYDGSITCYDTTSTTVTKTCSNSRSSNVLSSVTISDFCTSCSGST